MKVRSFILMSLVLFLAAGTVFGGGNNQQNTETAGTTIKVLFKGPKTDGFDAVYEEYLRRTRDTLNIKLDITFVEHADYREKLNLEITSGSDYDLVYDASWLRLPLLAADGYYADLREYFNNDRYPGLKKAFLPEVMESNLWFGKMCYIPLYRAYGNGVPAIHYRQDWADSWGIGRIDSYEKLERYWETAKSRGILPFAAISSRGFFQMFTVAGYFPGAPQAGIMNFDIAGISFMVYVKDGKLLGIAPQGAGDAAFKDFPAPWNRDFAMDRFEKFAEWNKKGYISPDSLTITDAGAPFMAGQAASYVGTLDDVESILRNLPDYSPEAVLGDFIYDENIRNMKPNSIPSTLAGNNGLSVPANSKKKDAVMSFLDWLFGSKENHDLFELGVQGVDYNINRDGTFKAITTYPAAWPGYGLTWNPNYVTYSEYITGKNREYRDYERKDTSFVLQPMIGFSFNGTDVNTASLVAQIKAVSDKVALTKLHGILSDGSRSFGSAKEMMNTNIAECSRAGLQKLQDEVARQIQAHLDGQKR
jgi:putative aldouronate transport system substrate-binding protein